MRIVKTATFFGKRWKIVPTESQLGGECDPPDKKAREMVIPTEGDTLFDLDCCIHEALHACFWWLEESFVERSATEIARLLWRLGWRKVQ